MKRKELKLGEIIFALIILLYILTLFILCFHLIPDSRLFPLIVIIPTAGFAVLKLLALANPKAAKVLEPDSGFLDLEKLHIEDPKKTPKTIFTTAKFKEIKVMGWVAALMAIVYSVGMLPAVAIFAFLFLKFHGGKSMRTSIAYTIGTWLFVYILFGRILHVRFYPGMLKIPFLH
jgi:hypothetical protein